MKSLFPSACVKNKSQVLIVLMLLFTTSALFAQEMEFIKANGVIISKPLSDEEWKKVKSTYVPDSLNQYTVTVVEYSVEEWCRIEEEAYRKALLKNGVDSTVASTTPFAGRTNPSREKWARKGISRMLERVKKEYKGKYVIKKTNELDTTDRFLLKGGFYNTADSEWSGYLSLYRFYFEDRKHSKVFPLMMRTPRKFFEKL